MGSNVASFLKILKDPTRARIILLLHEHVSIGYADLMKTLEITNTGKMNYHLKVLGDLLMKTEDGKYTLTEKGNLALRLLLEFPEPPNQSAGMKVSWGNVAWVVLSNASYLSLIAYLWFYGYVDINWLFSSVILFAAATVAILLVKTKMPNRTYSPQRMMHGYKILYIFFGAIAGILICWLGGGLIVVGLVTFLRSTGITVRFFSFYWWTIISWVIGVFAGGLAGYCIFRRSEHSDIHYLNPFA